MRIAMSVRFLWLLPGLLTAALAMGEPAAPVLHSEPLVAQRADPWVHRHDKGLYYFIASAPEFDRIELRAATTIAGIATAEPRVIWRKHDKGPLSVNIWAPELHHIDGVWYVHVAGGDAGVPGSIRMHVLANPAADPMQGEWRELGPVKTQRDAFSLDATHFEHRGQRYLVWAQKDADNKYNSALYIATMKSPTEFSSEEVMISEPVLPWEIIGYKVNEGAAVLKKNGRIFITYSASATDHNYAMGLLWADEDANLLDAAAWHKSPEPVFFTNEAVKRYGPGHNSFTLAEDGETVLMIYHARDYQGLQGTPLTDPNRHTYVRKLHWTADGMPDFRQHQSDRETFSDQ